MMIRRALIPVHRWVSLALLGFWLLQALTGILCVFHWELDDATISAPHRATDLTAIDRRLADLAPPGSGRRVTSLWTSAGAADRWDVTTDGPGAASIRIDGAGDVLRVRPDGERFADGGWLETAVILHQTLLAGDTGGWIVGLSGLALLSNIVMGLTIAWPRRRGWRQALRPPGGGRLVARLHGWHRAIGLWAAIPALLLVSAGVLRVFSDGFERVIGATAITVPPLKPSGPGIPFSQAATIALARHPGARLAGVGFPSPDDATWKVRLLTPGEPVRAYGNTTLFVDGNDGRVIADDPAAAAPLPRRIAALIYPLHTGEWAGIAGRLGVLAIGVWLASIALLGATLWWQRRRSRKPRPARAGPSDAADPAAKRLRPSP